MKKLTLFLLVVLTLSISCATMQKDAKKVACQQACEEAYEKCKKDAKGSKVKLAACEVTKDKCLKDCE